MSTRTVKIFTRLKDYFLSQRCFYYMGEKIMPSGSALMSGKDVS